MKRRKLLPVLTLLAFLLVLSPAVPALAAPPPYYVRDSNTSITTLDGDFGSAQNQAAQRISRGE